MAEKSKDSVEKGSFIDLEKSEYKKKNNFFKTFLIVIFIIIILISLFFVFPFLEKFIKYDEKNSEEVVKLSNSQNKVEINNQEQKSNNDLFSFIEDSNLISRNNQREIEKLKTRLIQIEQAILKLDSFSQNNLTEQDSEKYSLLLNFLTFKRKLQTGQDYSKQIDQISLMLINQNQVIELTSYFRELNFKKLKTKSELLDKLNEIINFKEEKFDQFIQRFEREGIKTNEGVFESKEAFKEYLKDIFNTTFKITKFEDKGAYDSQVIRKDILRDTLKLTKDYLLIGNFVKAYSTINSTNLEFSSELREWILNLQMVKDANNKLELLEIEILKLLGSDFD